MSVNESPLPLTTSPLDSMSEETWEELRDVLQAYSFYTSIWRTEICEANRSARIRLISAIGDAVESEAHAPGPEASGSDQGGSAAHLEPLWNEWGHHVGLSRASPHFMARMMLESDRSAIPQTAIDSVGWDAIYHHRYLERDPGRHVRAHHSVVSTVAHLLSPYMTLGERADAEQFELYDIYTHTELSALQMALGRLTTSIGKWDAETEGKMQTILCATSLSSVDQGSLEFILNASRGIVEEITQVGRARGLDGRESELHHRATRANILLMKTLGRSRGQLVPVGDGTEAAGDTAESSDATGGSTERS